MLYINVWTKNVKRLFSCFCWPIPGVLLNWIFLDFLKCLLVYVKENKSPKESKEQTDLVPRPRSCRSAHAHKRLEFGENCDAPGP